MSFFKEFMLWARLWVLGRYFPRTLPDAPRTLPDAPRTLPDAPGRSKKLYIQTPDQPALPALLVK